MHKLSLLIAALSLGLASACGPKAALYDLRCEGLENPLSIDSGLPHFSWKIKSRDYSPQTAYQIEIASTKVALEAGMADVWDSGRVASDEQVMVPYDGIALPSRFYGWWRVRIWTGGKDDEPSLWSPAQSFGVGIIRDDKMRGEYIGAVPGGGRSPLLRKKFNITQIPYRAFLYVNSFGYHEAYLNGRKISEAVLSPAVSQLNKRSLTVTYDLAPLLCTGPNEIVLWTGSGWYKSDTFGAEYDGPLVKAELVVDGMSVLCTDSSWQGTWSGYSDPSRWTPHQFGGEIIDARVVPGDLAPVTLDGLQWQSVDVVPLETEASPQMCEPCRIKETLSVCEFEDLGDGRYLADFGRIVNAMPEVSLPCLPKGHETVAYFSDFRAGDGTLEPAGSYVYISSGKASGDVFKPRFNHQVFRYVLFENLTQPPLQVKALRMRTDYAWAASFESSDPDLNAIHDMVAYTLDNLSFNGYMVDCANIERLGYGGDGNASTPTLQCMADVAPLYKNWLQAWVDAVKPDGGLPHTAPNPYRAGGGPYWCSFIVQAPWQTYRNYADKRLLEMCYPAMNKWLGYVDKYTVDGLLKKWPDYDYRYWYLGDWAAPEGVDVQDPVSIDLVNNCALCQVYMQLEEIAAVLGKPDDTLRFKARLNALRERIWREFYNPETGLFGTGSQIDIAYPLLVGAVKEDKIEEIVKSLKERTESCYGGHFVTGLVGIPVLTEWATLNRECDWFYSLLKKRDYPGYLYMLDKGATATWEHWRGERSRMHNCFNGIGSWFYQALGGISALEPGYKTVKIDPQCPKGLEWVKVCKRTPYGDITVRREGNRLHFEIPEGVEALVGGRSYPAGKYDIKLNNL